MPDDSEQLPEPDDELEPFQETPLDDTAPADNPIPPADEMDPPSNAEIDGKITPMTAGSVNDELRALIEQVREDFTQTIEAQAREIEELKTSLSEAANLEDFRAEIVRINSDLDNLRQLADSANEDSHDDDPFSHDVLMGIINEGDSSDFQKFTQAAPDEDGDLQTMPGGMRDMDYIVPEEGQALFARVPAVDAGGRRVYRWYLVAASNSVAVVKVTGNRSGGGKYSGFIADLSVGTLGYTGNLGESEIGSAGETSITIINAQEMGKSTHAITAATQVTKYFIGFKMPKPDASDLPVYLINGIDLKACT